MTDIRCEVCGEVTNTPCVYTLCPHRVSVYLIKPVKKMKSK